MKLTRAHAEFWACRQPKPGWAERFIRPDKGPSIHSCINAHAGLRLTNLEMSAHNLLSICRIIRNHHPENVFAELRRIAVSPGTLINPEQRARYARKWAQRIREARRRKAN